MSTKVGAVYQGPMEPHRLLVVLSDELERRQGEAAALDENLIKEARNLARSGTNTEAMQQSVSSLQEELQKYAPPFCYFGVHPDMRDLLGYWPNWDDVLRLPATECPKMFPGWCRYVNSDGVALSIWKDGVMEVEL